MKPTEFKERRAGGSSSQRAKMEEMKKVELVLIPTPEIGHLVSAIELAKLLTDQDEQIFIKILTMKLIFDSTVTNYIKSLSGASTSRVSFIELSDNESSSKIVAPNPFLHRLMVLESYKNHVRNILAEICNSSTSKLGGIIVDMFCTNMIDVANEFRVPTYLFYTTTAAMLGLVLHLQSLRDDFAQNLADYKDSISELSIPSYKNPVPVNILPSIVFDKGESSNVFLNHAKRYREMKGIIINTFLDLESYALENLTEDETLPPVYAVGPILNVKGSHNQDNEVEVILEWLDLQPNSSVVFLCFGSRGYFDKEQVKEIAYALEHSGYRFLWSLRQPPSPGKVATEFGNLEELLPEGFFQRSAEIGKVIGWAPQVQVLSHPAVGGFVSHCGWNSTLESIWFGVPMATWPLYAEQQGNAFQLVKDLEMAVEIKIDYRKNFFASTEDIVKADEIEAGIRRLMDPENEVRNKVKEMKERSRVAIVEGGSSYTSMQWFIEDMKKTIS
ncbi:hypothetical protein M9H77_24399 [Catharanthus roseus]|uniref:Uncharacterized protein n=1 Tax=Catharanthus roseus TaxID=4058 RepID=A0ACC0AWV8_CATRO|nr:hypothetical protein M9H77_24399 [Catharanthus roseus]